MVGVLSFKDDGLHVLLPTLAVNTKGLEKLIDRLLANLVLIVLQHLLDILVSHNHIFAGSHLREDCLIDQVVEVAAQGLGICLVVTHNLHPGIKLFSADLRIVNSGDNVLTTANSDQQHGDYNNTDHNQGIDLLAGSNLRGTYIRPTYPELSRSHGFILSFYRHDKQEVNLFIVID